MFKSSLSIVGYFPFLKVLINPKILTILFLGIFFESSVFLILLGKYINKNHFYETIILSALLSAFFDMFLRTVLVSLKETLSNFIEKHNKLEKMIHFSENYKKIAIIFYRFVPFSRWPVLISTILYTNSVEFFFFNLLGSFLWCFFYIYLGFYS